MITQNFTPMLENDPELACKWSAEKAEAWSRKHGWLVGCNYVPHNAINQLEMWQTESFDPFLIDKELGWAAGLGFNTVRVFLHHLVWEQDPQDFLHRIVIIFIGCRIHIVRLVEKVPHQHALIIFECAYDSIHIPM